MRLHVGALTILLLCIHSSYSFFNTLSGQGKTLKKNLVSLSAANAETVVVFQVFQISLYFITGYLVMTANQSLLKDARRKIMMDKEYRDEIDKSFEVAFGKLKEDLKELESNARFYTAVTAVAFTAFVCFEARDREWHENGKSLICFQVF